MAGIEKDPSPAYATEASSTTQKDGFVADFINGFRPHPVHAAASQKRRAAAEGGTYDIEQAAINVAESPLSRKLKGRHLQMIAIGGSIGTGLFVGSGKALATGGPASLLIAFGLIGGMLYCVVHALGELAVLFPIAGSFSAYSTRFLDPAWGFAMGWNYALQWLIVLPLEIVAASITIDYWHSSVNKAVWVTIFWVLIVIINLFGVKGYGEAEFVFSIIKVVAVIGFIILGIILDVGGGPNGDYIGGRHWHDPGAFHSGFKGLCSVFVTAAFAFAGTELVGLAAAETANPRKSLPTAVKQVFWRIFLFYIVSLTLVGLLVPYNEPRLLSGKSSADASASPFVIAIENASIEALPSIMNVVIMIAVLSVGNSSVYGSSRTLAALADQGQAPRILGYIDRRGRPMVGIALSALLGLLGYLAASDKQGEAFGWMLAISGLSSIFTWGSVCLAHIRFRRGWAKQGHSLDELAYQSQPGVFGSWCGFILNCLVLIAQFWVAVWPIGEDPDVEVFFSIYLTVPVVLAFYIPYKIIYKTPFVRSATMDLTTGRRELPSACTQESLSHPSPHTTRHSFPPQQLAMSLAAGRRKILMDLLFLAAAQVSLYYFMKWVINYRDPDRERKEQIKKKSNAILRRLDQNNDKKGGGRLDKLVLSSYEKTILTEVVAPEDIHISFQDIGGLENIIEELRESVIYPLTTPHLYSATSSLLSAPKGVLLYGPPGCGKTMLAKALAHESGACFINLHISTLTEKWYGDSNKLVSAVFTLARKLQPTIVFIDEIDAVLRSRSSQDHEASTMVKAEFMTHWDGLLSASPTTGAASQILILGATNRIQDIDEAILRRLPKKFPINLPDATQRRRILTLILRDTKLAEGFRFDELVARTAGMSGSDLTEACRDAAMVPIREYIRTFAGRKLEGVNRDDVRGVVNEDFFRRGSGGRRPVEEELAGLGKVIMEVNERIEEFEAGERVD